MLSYWGRIQTGPLDAEDNFPVLLTTNLQRSSAPWKSDFTERETKHLASLYGTYHTNSLITVTWAKLNWK